MKPKDRTDFLIKTSVIVKNTLEKTCTKYRVQWVENCNGCFNILLFAYCFLLEMVM